MVLFVSESRKLLTTSEDVCAITDIGADERKDLVVVAAAIPTDGMGVADCALRIFGQHVIARAARTKLGGIAAATPRTFTTAPALGLLIIVFARTQPGEQIRLPATSLVQASAISSFDLIFLNTTPRCLGIMGCRDRARFVPNIRRFREDLRSAAVHVRRETDAVAQGRRGLPGFTMSCAAQGDERAGVLRMLRSRDNGLQMTATARFCRTIERTAC
ncbi:MULTISPECIES: hypothetical protein [unclassified Bradyrhizobium]|uniref:hypothetical protein n=1 Tax=unclassified Bradyrhizobium TaxID=2631580 RepID=UPI0028F0DC91|nr:MULTISPECIES: hypothetical protein [unclassified Bradyrhizobium]